MADVAKPQTPENLKPKDSKIEDTKNEKVEEDLSDEDKALQDELNLYVERLQEGDENLYEPALEQLRSQIKASTTSMTAVPKPLKFLRNHFPAMKEIHLKIKNLHSKKFCADIISVLAMTISEGRDCLHYKLQGLDGEIGEWGHEYVRHLSGEIAQEWIMDANTDKKEVLLGLAHKIIPYNLQHNAEAEACDLVMELEHLEILEKFVEIDTYQRVCAYISSCVAYVPDPENVRLLRTVLNIYRRFQQWPLSLIVAMQLNDSSMAQEIFQECEDHDMKKQLAFMIGRQQMQINVEIGEDETNKSKVFKGQLNDILTNSLLNENFKKLGIELDIIEPKTPDEVYKTHLDGNRPVFGPQVDSARQNLAASFVSGFVNAGFGRDKLLTQDANKWLYKNKEHGMLSATASLGLILLWDVDGGLGQIDKYLYSAEDYIKAGALLACGIVNCGVRNECDPALALLADYVHHQSSTMKVGAILGLGLAYAGTNNSDVMDLLTPTISAGGSDLEVISMAALSCGLIAVGTGAEVAGTLLEYLMERSENDLKNIYVRFVALAIGLIYLGKQEEAETFLAALSVLPDPYKSMAVTLVEVCAYAGTGNVLKIQNLLHICSEHYETEAKDEKDNKNKDKKEDKEKAETPKDAKEKAEKPLDLSSQQAVAVLGIALIAMGEDIGTEMAFRSLGHLLRYCEPSIRRTVPLALALLSVSNPRLSVLDILSKFSHDVDNEVALNSIFGMGIIGAGTNNARIAAMLRQLALYHAKDSNNLFMVRIAQGLVYLGKGTLGLTPFHADRQLLSPVAVAGLLSTMFSFLDVREMILGKGHYMLYCLATAMNPPMLVTIGEDLKSISVPVRVGQAVDTVGVAGNPKTITGFQTYQTPVLLGYGERAELATDDYVPLSPILEGFVILKKKEGVTLPAEKSSDPKGTTK